ncbi:dihydrofolate reductase family protein [Luteimonas sp. SX5]|uniref:Dihydrofolate reductase family protein n=1 Tax=Luteimonas galliterrae TaxID=2940486 RepID=A0ABT0MP49_9GAMM|nr:dihydrofolate reductase family protein [Luteimonas galliterrae]MCL1636064.1 dihydrofolate reductase family protein [Luteimonas galliterrae]
MNRATARIARALPVDKLQPAYPLWPAANGTFAPSPRRELLQMRKLKYHVNVSVDGFILSQGEGFDAFPHGDESAQYLQSLHAYGIALMGRRTYEASQKTGIDDPYPHLMSYVFSRSSSVRTNPQVELVRDEATDWVRRMKACPGKDLYLCGGADLAASLFKAGLIDEVILKVNPLLKGAGRRLLSGLETEIALVHNSSAAYDDGVVMLTYRVQKNDVGQPIAGGIARVATSMHS